MERSPEAQGRMWFRRVGSRFAHRFGGRLRKDFWEGGEVQLTERPTP